MNSMSGATGFAQQAQRGKGPGFSAGSGYDLVQNYTPEQMDVFQNQHQALGPDSYTSRLARGDPGIFQESEAPAWQQFNEAQGQNASRFSGQGMGSRRGSAFKNSNNAASSNFAMQLQSRRQDLMRQAVQDLHGMSQDFLGNSPYNRQEKEPSWWEKLVGFGAPIAGGIGGFALGGPAGAAAGAQLGGRLGSSFLE